MTLHLKVESTSDNLDIYEERELMFTAWENKNKIDKTIRMPEVELVQRVLAASLEEREHITPNGAALQKTHHKGVEAYV